MKGTEPLLLLPRAISVLTISTKHLVLLTAPLGLLTLQAQCRDLLEPSLLFHWVQTLGDSTRLLRQKSLETTAMRRMQLPYFNAMVKPIMLFLRKLLAKELMQWHLGSTKGGRTGHASAGPGARRRGCGG